MIAGGGLAGCRAAPALAEKRPDVSLLLLDQSLTFGGNHIWSFFGSDIRTQDHWLIEPLISARWDAYDVSFPERKRTLPTAYNSIRSETLHHLVHKKLEPHQFRLNTSIARVDADNVTLETGERICDCAVIDARPPRRALSRS